MPDEKIVSGLRVSKQWFCETCPLVRKQTAGNTEIGWQSRGSVDTTELLLRSRTNLLAASVISMTLSIDPVGQRCHPLSGFPSSGPKLVTPPYQNSTGEILHLKQQRCWRSAQHSATHHTALSPHDWSPWKPRLLLELDPVLFSSCYLPGDEPITVQMRPKAYIVRHLQGLFTYYAYQKNTVLLFNRDNSIMFNLDKNFVFNVSNKIH